MGKTYKAVADNLATKIVDALSPETLGSCDPVCDMNLTELRDFWWAYCYDLISRLPMTNATQLEHSMRVLTTDADALLAANNATSEDFFRKRTEPRLGILQVTRFGFLHLVPTLAETIDPDLKAEVQALIEQKYGAPDKCGPTT